ncbi:MAG: hypothetical protein Q4D14_06040, partial [Bacteroidales bacterium]|nr:hypothetical protein [Bacteroidales bacterium]
TNIHRKNHCSIVMKKTLLLIVTCALALLCGCKPNPNEIKNVSGVEYYYIERDRTEGFYGYDQCYEYFVIVNDEIRRVAGDVDYEWTEDGMIYLNAYKVNDYYRTNDHEIILGTHYYVNNGDSIASPYWEIDGVKKEIQMDVSACGRFIIEENGTFYFIIESLYGSQGTNVVNQSTNKFSYFVSCNGATPTKLFEMRKWHINIRNVTKAGDQFYFVGIDDGLPFFITTGESIIDLSAQPRAGAVYDARVVDNKECFYGYVSDSARIWTDGYMEVLDCPSSRARCAREIDGDVYIGGNIGKDPVIWKNGELIARYTNIDRSTYFPAGPNGVMTVYQNVFVIDMEVVGDKIYSLIQLSTESYEAMFAALVWDLSTDPVEAEMMYELKDIIADSEYTYTIEDGKRYWFENDLDFKQSFWKMCYTRPRINLLRK